MMYGYARVSTTDQDPELQLQALRKAGCDAIREERVSGKAGVARPIRDAVLRRLKPGDTLTIWKLDRLGRSLIELETIVSDLERRGIKFRCLTQPIDTSSPMGWMFFQMLAAFAEFERTLNSERVKAGKAAKRANGGLAGGPRPYGLELDYQTPRPEEAAVIRYLAEHVLHGDRLGKLVDSLNARGIPTKDGKRWRETNARRILLAGYLMPSILDQATHDQLVAIFKPADGRTRAGRPATHLLSGILTCGAPDCSGAPMYVAHVNNLHGRDYEVYRCQRSGGGRHQGCGKVSIRTDTVEQWILDAAAATVASEHFAKALEARRRAIVGASSEELAAMKAELADLRATPARFRDRIDPGGHHQAELQARIKAVAARLMAAPELADLEELPADAATWHGWDIDRQRRALKLLLEQVRVLPAGKGSKFDGSRLDPAWKL
jgi:DNA invertase Pin-like site-specific DNA recombinase